MASELKVDMKNAIKTLLSKGISHRQAASLLMIDRKTVARYAGLLKAQNGPEEPTGSESENGQQVPPTFPVRRVPVINIKS